MCEPRKRMQLMYHSAAISPRPHPATGEYRSPPVGGHHRQARRIAFGSYGPPPSASLAGCGVSTWRVRPPTDPGRGVRIEHCTSTAARGRSLGNAPPASAVIPARSDWRRASKWHGLVRCRLSASPANGRREPPHHVGGCEAAGVNKEPRPSVLQARPGSPQAFEPGVRTAS